MPDGQPQISKMQQQALKSGKKDTLRVEVARTIEDMMRIVAIRAAVYMAEQSCPYDEEFDGNDFCATHLIGYVGDQPAACVRLRFFGGFAKMERMAVLHTHRNTRIAFKTIRTAIAHCNRKGFTRIYGHARDELIPLWKMFGFRIMENDRPIVFSDFTYTEMVHDSPPAPDVITLETDPYVMIRPEGAWDESGILEESAARDANKHMRDFAIAAE